MKWCKATRLSVLIVLPMALFLGNLDNATAGIEPSPFQPEINQLGAVENVLVSANRRIVKTMEHPPDPCVPSDSCAPGPDLNGALNRLGAINKQLVSADQMVASIVEEVMGVEPTPFQPLADIVPALAGVQGAAQVIVDEIAARLGVEPSPFRDALLGVQESAETISTHTQEYINQIEEPCPDTVACGAFDSQEACESVVCCKWITSDDVSAESYCDIDPDYPLGD